jgi:y4mF family transcriptional regulator
MKVPTSQELGQAIRERRKALGYTQTELADFSGCGLTFISALERGKKTSQLEKVLQVVSTLGVDLLFEPRGQYQITRSSEGLSWRS